MAKSNKQWLRRHVTDPYVRKAREQGYRSRSAFKLLEIDDKEKLLRPGAIVVDLGAAPGGWSQVAAARVKPGGRVIAIDLLKIAPITGVEVMAADFRVARLEGVRADIVLSRSEERRVGKEGRNRRGACCWMVYRSGHSHV